MFTYKYIIRINKQSAQGDNFDKIERKACFPFIDSLFSNIHKTELIIHL